MKITKTEKSISVQISGIDFLDEAKQALVFKSLDDFCPEKEEAKKGSLTITFEKGAA